jgi:hypothetical protein
MIVRAGCTWIRLHSGCNKRKPDFGRVGVTHLKVRLGLGMGQKKVVLGPALVKL